MIFSSTILSYPTIFLAIIEKLNFLSYFWKAKNGWEHPNYFGLSGYRLPHDCISMHDATNAPLWHPKRTWHVPVLAIFPFFSLLL
jgi:hypothetical protein